MRTTLIGGTVLVDDQLVPDTTVSFEDGRILGIGQPSGRTATVDARGLLLLPGIVDLHADAIERALEPRPGVRLPLAVALAEHDAWLVANGITTCFVSLTDGFEPGLRSRDGIRQVADALDRAARRLRARTPLHLRREVCAEGDPGELAAWLGTGRIALLSINDHLPRAGDPQQERRFIASLARRLNGHAGDADGLLAAARSRRDAGLLACDRLCGLALAHAVPLAAHDDATPEQAEASAARGAAISEFPADLATARRARSLGSQVLMGAPNAVRGASHIGWMSACDAIAAECCDALCSDYHHPSLLHAPFELVRRGINALPAAWRLVSRNPAAAAGLADRGRIAPGLLADLVLVDAGPPLRVRAVWVGGVEAARFA